MKKHHWPIEPKIYRKCVIILLLLFLLLTELLMLKAIKPNSARAELPNGGTMPQAEQVEKNTDSIAIPGYEGISLKADTKQQTVGLPNPPQNTCYFKITLLLEDGTVLWQSELVEPGAVSEPIKLKQPLKKGTYSNSLLKYECFTMDGNMKALNSAATKLTLRVS